MNFCFRSVKEISEHIFDGPDSIDFEGIFSVNLVVELWYDSEIFDMRK